jgi:hypothetical protein
VIRRLSSLIWNQHDMNFEDNLPRSLVHINSLNPSTVSWESMRGKGLPDPSGNEWNLIISFFEKGHGERNDQTKLVKKNCGNLDKRNRGNFMCRAP